MKDAAPDLVRDIHNAVAERPDLGVASCRVQGTTPLELRLMTRDVLRKLQVGSDLRVLEIGCGVGVLGLPIARRAAAYVGVDFADRAVEVFERRLAAGNLRAGVDLRVFDFVAAVPDEVDALGRFDRILAYSVLHYVRDESDGKAFVHRALTLTRPRGRVLLGNLPVVELADGIWPPANPSVRRGQALRWAIESGYRAAGLTIPRRWRLGHVAYSHFRPRVPSRSSQPEAPASLPPGYVVDLTMPLVEEWVRTAPVPVRVAWRLSAIGVPQYYSRLDLVLIRDD